MTPQIKTELLTESLCSSRGLLYITKLTLAYRHAHDGIAKLLMFSGSEDHAHYLGRVCQHAEADGNAISSAVIWSQMHI